MSQEPSTRSLLARRLIQHCKQAKILTDESRLLSGHDSKNRKFYFFWLPKSAFHDSTICVRVYGEKSIMIATDLPFTETNSYSFIFKREEHLIKFLDQAFILQDFNCLVNALKSEHAHE